MEKLNHPKGVLSLFLLFFHIEGNVHLKFVGDGGEFKKFWKT